MSFSLCKMEDSRTDDMVKMIRGKSQVCDFFYEKLNSRFRIVGFNLSNGFWIRINSPDVKVVFIKPMQVSTFPATCIQDAFTRSITSFKYLINEINVCIAYMFQNFFGNNFLEMTNRKFWEFNARYFIKFPEQPPQRFPVSCV